MDYLYYPGCSLEGTAMEYDRSCRALFAALGMELVEIEDWTCCGATAAQCVDELLSVVLPARNLALAEKTDPGKDILVPCSACYLNLEKARQTIRTDSDMRLRVNQILAPDGLAVTGSNRVRHLLDVLSRDGAVDQVAARAGTGMAARAGTGMAAQAGTGMADLVVAPYYGCQCLRPFHAFDNPEQPRSMDALIRATGARVLAWDMGAACCGASTAATSPGVGQARVAEILDQAGSAHAVVTVCPMCQMNLERFQTSPVPILYLTQFLGLAMALSPESLGCGLNLSDVRPVVMRGMHDPA